MFRKHNIDTVCICKNMFCCTAACDCLNQFQLLPVLQHFGYHHLGYDTNERAAALLQHNPSISPAIV